MACNFKSSQVAFAIQHRYEALSGKHIAHLVPSALSPGDDLRLEPAIRLRGESVRSDVSLGIGCDSL